MLRLALLFGVAAFCLLTAAPPDPRMLASIDALAFNHTHQLEEQAGDGFYCPMDPDVRAGRPGKCVRCGMQLVEGAPDILEFPLDLRIDPAVPRVIEPTRLTFAITDPRTQQPVRRFEVMHEKLYHVFVVSQDLQFFQHVHPERESDAESFHLDVRFPKAGMYRVLSDFYPGGGSPQLITNTLIVPGANVQLTPAKIVADIGPQKSDNAEVKMSIVNDRVVARRTATLMFDVGPKQGLERYLGTWGHMLTASSDLVDIVHRHPVATPGNDGSKMQFDMLFSRPGVYRVWLQFQRLGVVNTVAFNVPVMEK